MLGLGVGVSFPREFLEECREVDERDSLGMLPELPGGRTGGGPFPGYFHTRWLNGREHSEVESNIQICMP